MVVVLMNSRKAEAFQGQTHASFVGKHTQWQANEEAQGPDQDKHEDDHIQGGGLVRVGDDHGAGHGHGAQ